MAITIPDDIRYNGRSYDIGEVIELEESMMGSQPEHHPLFRLMLQYIASPFSDNNYDRVEDILLHFLNPSFLTRLSERDSDVIFDEEEYRKHVEYAWSKLNAIQVDKLIQLLMDYVGDKKQLKTVLSQGLLKEGKETLVSEINTELGTDHILSAHTKGLETKKIFQAADKGEKYMPALDLINDILKDEEVKQSEYVSVEVAQEDTKIQLPKTRKKVSVTEQIYTIRIDFESLFYKLFENEGILPISKRGRDPPPFVHSRNFKVKKAENKYQLHSDYPATDNDKKLLKRIHLKQDWNALHDEEISVDKENYDPKTDILSQEARGFLNDIRYIGGQLVDAKLMTEAKLDKVLDEGKIFSKLDFDDLDIMLVNKVIKWKETQDIRPNEFELKILEKQSEKRTKRVFDTNNRRTQPIIHAPKTSPNGHKRFFINDSWQSPDGVQLDLKNAMSYSRAMKNTLEDILIPNKVGILQIELSTVHPSDSERQDRIKYAEEDDDEDVRANSKYLLDKIYDVFYLEGVSYHIVDEFEFKDWTERSPEGKGSWQKQKKLRGSLKQPKAPGGGLAGKTQTGGQPTNVSVKTNTIIYYIKRQMANLQRVLT